MVLPSHFPTPCPQQSEGLHDYPRNIQHRARRGRLGLADSGGGNQLELQGGRSRRRRRDHFLGSVSKMSSDGWIVNAKRINQGGASEARRRRSVTEYGPSPPSRGQSRVVESERPPADFLFRRRTSGRSSKVDGYAHRAYTATVSASPPSAPAGGGAFSTAENDQAVCLKQ